MSDKIDLSVWVKIGKMLVRRDCLPSDHPESEYNYIRNVLNLIPEDYGIYAGGASGKSDKTFDFGWAASGVHLEQNRGRK
jgi:hypothetical protein